VRIGTAEIYNALHIIDEIEDSLIIHLTNEYHEKLLLFVQSNDTLDFSLIKSHIRNQCSPRHIPDEMIRVPAIPFTISGKKGRSAYQTIIDGDVRRKDFEQRCYEKPIGY
jgi:acetoacetyl-CoA synthetase